jgi:hypothetical protein
MGRVCTVVLLVKEKKIIFPISKGANLSSTRRSTVLSRPFQKRFPGRPFRANRGEEKSKRKYPAVYNQFFYQGQNISGNEEDPVDVFVEVA